MAAASKKSPGGKTAAAAKTEESTKKCEGPSPAFDDDAKSSTFSRVLLVPLFVVLIVGTVLGAYLAAYLLESEYKNIVSQLESNHHAAILQTQTNYIECHSNLTDEKQSNEEELAKYRMHADQNERAFQNRAEQYLKETSVAYKMTNEGLQKASSRLKTEVEKLATHPLSSSLRMEVEKHESTQLQLLQVEKRLQAIRNTLTDSTRALKTSEHERDETNKQLQYLQLELDSAEEDLERRDIERAECDVHHRNMLECREALKDALVDLANNDESPALSSEESSNVMKVAMKASAAQLTQAMEQKKEMMHEVESLRKRLVVKDTDREYWEAKANSIIEKVRYRNHKEALEEFGPGPHYVKLTFEFQSSPVHESILLELAPLGSMPHTVHTFLQMVRKNILADGTMILSRAHILVGGPVDTHDQQNNADLEERMIQEGYFPNGAMLFREYTPDFPHTEYTLGFNAIGGPIFYVNLKDNTVMHGPSYSEQGGIKEGDPCFAKIVEGVDVIQRIVGMPTAGDDSLESAVYIVDSQVVNITS